MSLRASSCARCGRSREPAGTGAPAGKRLCATCLPSFEAALTSWLRRTAGAHDDLSLPGWAKRV
jgi:hypothetical protein